MNNFVFGMYENNDSFINNLDAFSKLLCFLFLVVGIVFINNIVVYFIWFIIVLFLFYLSKLSIGQLVLYIYKIRWFLLILLLMNFCFYDVDDSFFKWWIISLSLKGFIRGLSIVIRLLLLLCLSYILSFSCPPLKLAKAMETLFYPLRFIGVNVKSISMILSIALEFIPILYEESESIKKAQISRGADFNSKNIKKRITSVLSLVTPIFIASFKRADDLSLAMEARGYDIDDNTYKVKINFEKNDYLALIFCVLFCILTIYFKEAL